MDSFSIQNYFKRGKTVVLTLRQGDDEQVRQWSDKDTTELMKLMNIFLPEFQNQRRRKKEVWVDVAKQLQETGYAWTPEDCRKKWSNMIRTFKGIEEQKQDPTSNWKRVKWPFYDSMLELLSLNGSDAFPEALTVVQLLNNGCITTAGLYNKKNPYRTTVMGDPNIIAHHHQLIDTIQSASHVGHTQESLQIGPETDIVGVQDHTDSLVADGTEIPTGSELDSNVLFIDPPVRFKPPEPVQASTSSVSLYRHSLAVKAKKRSLKRKNGKSGKKSSGDDATDDTLQKFIETVTKQNEQMMHKITQFHENALTLMHERNVLLREIRDSLCEGDDGLNSVDVHQDLEETEDDTLTLHVGPAFSTAAGDVHQTAEDESQLNSTLMISTDPAAANALSTFHLEDGTVISGIDTTQDKTVLTSLGPFTNSVMPEVSLSNLGTILHPTLVSVVAHTRANTSNMTLAIPSNTVKQKHACEK